MWVDVIYFYTNGDQLRNETDDEDGSNNSLVSGVQIQVVEIKDMGKKGLTFFFLGYRDTIYNHIGFTPSHDNQITLIYNTAYCVLIFFCPLPQSFQNSFPAIR